MHCNALQLVANGNSFTPHTAMHCNAPQCTAMHCNALQLVWQLVANGLPMATVMPATVLATATTGSRVWAREQESERA